jgi:hypothetical protein
MMKMRRVVIEVSGGIAYVVEAPLDVEVIINDLD